MDRVETKTLLHAHGYKATPSMVAVLDILDQKKKPLSIENILNHLKRKIDTSTVYRILERFKEKGIVRTVDLQHKHVHYEMKRDDDHHHLVCTLCGKIEDIAGCDVDSFAKKIVRSSRGFATVSSHTLELFGVCHSCSKKTNKTSH